MPSCGVDSERVQRFYKNATLLSGKQRELNFFALRELLA
jgi:hypothetical protein